MLIKQFKLKQSPRLKNKRSLLALILGVMLSLSFGAACGKRKPPRPPEERVIQRVEIEANQVGSQINLSWQMPARNASKGSTLNINRADIYRLAE